MTKKTQQIPVPLISVVLGIFTRCHYHVDFGYDAIWGYEELFKAAFGTIRSIGEISAQWVHYFDCSWVLRSESGWVL